LDFYSANTLEQLGHIILIPRKLRAVTTIEADEVVASSDFLKKKILQFGSVNLDAAGSIPVFSMLQVLRFSGSLSLGLSIEISIISFIS